MHRHVFTDHHGNPARRRWPDACWPLRGLDGRTYAERDPVGRMGRMYAERRMQS